MPLRCPDPRCNGVLTHIVDTRDGSYTGGSANKVFNIARSHQKGDGFHYRLRECSRCGKRSVTIEIVHLPPITTRPVRHNQRTERCLPGNAPTGSAQYTGTPCTNCGSMRTIRSGTCVQCLDCYWSGECG